MDTDKYDMRDDKNTPQRDTDIQEKMPSRPRDDDFATADTVYESKLSTSSFRTRRKPRGFKIALIILAVLFVLFVAVLYLLPHFLPMDTIRGIAKAKARELAGMDLDFKNLSFSWNGSVVLDGIKLSPLNAAGEAGDPLLTVDEVRTNVAVSPLLSGKIVVNSLDVNGFAVRLRRAADGTLNLPDLEKLTASAKPAPSASPARQRLSAVHAAETATAASLPPVEVHRVNLKNGTLGFEDKMENRSIDVELDYLNIKGSTLNDPFLLTGRLLPYPGADNKGDIPFTGRVAMIKNGAFDPAGEAAMEIDVRSFAFHDLAEKLGFGELLASGQANGLVKVAYNGGKALLVIPDIRVSGAAVGLPDNRSVALPDSAFGINATFDPGPGVVSLTEISLANELNNIKAKGWVEGVNDLAAGGMPVASIEYTGVVDFAKAMAFVAKQDLGVGPLPEAAGTGSYFGKLALPKKETPSAPLAPYFTLDFNDGDLSARDAASGIAFRSKLSGIAVKAAARVGDQVEVNSAVTFQNVPASAVVPQIGTQPINLTANGEARLTAGQVTGVELRMQNARAQIPASPYAGAMDILSPEMRLAYNLERDQLNIETITFSINEAVKGNVAAGSFTGLAAGNPQGQTDIVASALMDAVKTLFQPLIPDIASRLAGTMQASARIKLENGRADAAVRAEVDKLDVVLALPQAQAAVASPKATVALQANAELANPLVINLGILDVTGSDATLQMVDQKSDSAAGRFGAAGIKAAGIIDVAAGWAEFSSLAVSSGGMQIAFGQGGKQIAGLESGVMQAVLATPEKHIRVPLGSSGDFNVPALEAGVDKLAFHLLSGDKPQTSNFGNLRARIGADGYIGSGKPQIINLRSAELFSNMMNAKANGQFDLGTGAVAAAYAARLAPAGMAPLLDFLKLPPAMLDDLAASGTMVWNGSQLASKGAVQGKLRISSNEASPFEMNHDLSAAYNAQEQALIVEIRRLDGNVKTGAGEAVATLAAHQSNLMLSKSGIKGLLDIRVNGAAGPTRQLALGLTGVLPQLRSVSETLYKTQAGGVYNAWFQIKEKDPTTVGVTLGGVWQGAALQIDSVPYLAEAGKLTAGLEGEYSYRDQRINVTRLMFQSDSALVQAAGNAQAVLSTGQDRSINGVGSVNVDLSFRMDDLAKLPLVFPGAVPADLGLAGRMAGQFKAGGNATDIRVEQGAVQFQGFQAAPGGMKLAIPSGAASFGAQNLSLNLNAPVTGSPYDAVKLVNVANGQGTVTGAQFQGKNISAMSAAFDVQNGVVTLRNAQMVVEGAEGAAATASGTIDFTPAAPAANLQVAVRNFPLAEVNSEIKDYMEIQSGVISMPANGQSAGVAFQGFSEDEILRTLRLENFTFATGPVAIHTGPLLNVELDKARAIMKQETAKSGEARLITFKSITGSATAAGDGQLIIPTGAPINVIGDNTADFRAQGVVSANHTMNMDFFIVGQLEKLIGFTLPNLIPNLRSGTDEEKNRFMATMNRNAANGHYKINLSGPLERPDLSGIGQVAGMFMVDIVKAAPGQIIGGVLELGKDAPGAIIGAAGAILNPENVTNPSRIINAPKNIGKGIGRAFGFGGSSEEEETQEPQAQQQQQQQPQQQPQLQPQLQPQQQPQQQQQPQPQQEQQQEQPRNVLPLPFLRNR